MTSRPVDNRRTANSDSPRKTCAETLTTHGPGHVLWERRQRLGRLAEEGQRRLVRQSILESAIELFAVKGLRGTKMDAVAASAHVSKTQVYSHFPSKNDLFFAAFAAEQDLLRGRVVEPLIASASSAHDFGLLDRCESIAKLLFAHHRERPYAFALLFGQETWRKWSEARRELARELAHASEGWLSAPGPTVRLPQAQARSLAWLLVVCVISSIEAADAGKMSTRTARAVVRTLVRTFAESGDSVSGTELR